MELEFKSTQLAGYTSVVNTTLFSEETMESIVPDACPDVLRILNTSGFICIKSKEAQEGRLEVRGVINAQVLYVPEDSDDIRHISVSFPFSCGMDHNLIRSGCVVHIIPRLLSADTRLLNPRKVYIRTELAIEVSCYAPDQRKIASGCDCESRFGVQEKSETYQACLVKAVQSKSFSFSDDLSLPGSKPDMEELLSHRLDISCSESKVIGSKLIFKGQALLTLLYRSADNLLATACFELPFSQIMEVAETEEEADCDLQVILNDVTCQSDKEDPRIISVAISFFAQAVLRERKSIELLSDMYSTIYELTVESQEDLLCQFSECSCVRQDIREVVETPVPVGTVIDSSLNIGPISQNWEGRLLRLSADVRINILYKGEEGELYALTRPLAASCQMEGDPQCRYLPSCRCAGDCYAVPTSGGIEVRVPIDFGYRVEKQRPVKEVVRASLEENAACDAVQRPSIVLRRAEANESLWDIAKAYATTSQDILEANELSEYGCTPGQMLLIPKKR